MRKFLASFAAVAAAATLSITLASPVAAQPAASPEQGPLNTLPRADVQGADWYAVAPNGDTYIPNRNTDNTGVAPLIDPADRLMCANGVQKHMVNSWEIAEWVDGVDGQIRLNCGTANAGYIHIAARHAVDWTNVMPGGAAGGGVWDDFMEFVVGASITAPNGFVTLANGKTCVDTPIVVVVDGVGWTHYWPVIISNNNHIVITSYPAPSGCLSAT
jgi:hypothetical protein